MRTYTCTITHNGGFGGGYGGTYSEQFVYASDHRANSKANLEDAITQWKQRKGYGFSSVEASCAVLGEWA